MKILVAVKRVPDPNIPLPFLADGRPDLSAAKWVLNPFDEIALEEAILQKERGHADDVLAVTIAPEDADAQLRTALALGADRALRIHVDSDDDLDPLLCAKALAALITQEQPDLILLGKQGVDTENGMVGPILSGLLNSGLACNAEDLELSANGARVTCEMDDGMAILALALPAVVTADLRLNTPRYATMMNIMKSKKAVLEQRTLADLGITLAQPLAPLAVSPTSPRSGGRMVKNVDELIQELTTRELLP